MHEVPSISGATVTTTRRILGEMLGKDVFERALAKLPGEKREEYVGATALSWVPVDLLDEVFRLAAEESGHALKELQDEAVKRTQEELLHTVYRILMRITTDEALISRTPTFYSKTYNIGKLTSTFPGKGEALVTLSEWPSISDLQLHGLAMGIQTTLRVAGRKDARAIGKRTKDGAEYHCVWKK